MKVTTERMPESQVLLNIELDEDQVERSMDQAYRRIAPRTRIPGFRPGKAPRSLVERHVGRAALLEEALDKLVPQIVAEAIQAEAIDMIDTPRLEIASLDPVVVKATVPVRPSIELGGYRDTLRIERQPVEVEPAKVDEVIAQLREQYSTIEPVERPVEDGDTLRADIKATTGDETVAEEEDAELTVTEEGLASLPGLYPHLLGASAGQTVTAETDIPDEAGNQWAGRTVHYEVAVKDVKTTILPDLDDDFALTVGENFPTLEALRERLTSDLRERLETEADRQLETDALDRLAQEATLEFPPQLVEREIHRMLHDSGLAVDDQKRFNQVLRQIGRSEAEIHDQLRPDAIDRVRRSLILGKLSDAEGIEIGDADVGAELDSMAEGPRGAQIRQLFDTESGRDMIRRNLLTRRTLERLRQIALGEAPALVVSADTISGDATAETVKPDGEVDEAAVDAEVEAAIEQPADAMPAPGEPRGAEPDEAEAESVRASDD